MKLTGPAATVRKARRLRRDMTLPEVLLWARLRGVTPRFRRQHPAGPYVLDFFCATARLVVEVDGIAHATGNAHDHDARRDAWLTTQGLGVIRLAARDVLRDADSAADSIVAMARAASPLHHRKGDGPPPPKPGEDLRNRPWNT